MDAQAWLCVPTSCSSICVSRLCCAYHNACIVHIRVCIVCTVWMQSMLRSDKVWMARLWRQVLQVAALSLRQLDIQPHHHPIQFHHQHNIWVWHMIMFGQMDEVVCIFRSINRLSGYKGPVESVAQLKGTNWEGTSWKGPIERGPVDPGILSFLGIRRWVRLMLALVGTGGKKWLSDI